MKRIITLLAVALTANLSIGQTVFQSDLSSWASGDPTDFFGPVTSIASSNVTEVTTGATYGTSFANIVNATTSHKRLTTQPFTAVPNTKYIIKMYIAGNADIRVRAYDASNSAYVGNYTSYQTTSGTAVAVYTDSVTTPVGCTSLSYIISLRNTATLGIALDSVSITAVVGPPPPPAFYSPKTIYDVQYTASTSGDSPYEDSLVELTGVVTGVSADTRTKGYFIQDSAKAWNGIFVNDGGNIPARGDKVTVRGQVKENFDNTQIMSVDTMIAVSSGNAEPTPITATSATAADEMYEGVLLKVSAAMCVDTVVRFGEWFIAGTAIDTLMVDDLLLSTTYNPVLNQGYDVTGVMFYSFGNFKIEPRDSTDIQQSLAVSIEENSNDLNVSIFPNPVNDIFTVSGVELGTAEIFSAEGKLVQSFSLNYINTVNVSQLGKGVYILRIVSDNKVGITRFVKQ